MTAETLRKGEGNRGEAIPCCENGFARTRTKGFEFGEELPAGRVTKEVSVIKPEVSKGRHSESREQGVRFFCKSEAFPKVNLRRY